LIAPESAESTAGLANKPQIRHSLFMPANAPTSSTTDPTDLGRGLVTRLVRYFKAQVEDWYDVCRQLSTWEERHLVDQPTPECMKTSQSPSSSSFSCPRQPALQILAFDP
jgi:hypothetical protein